MKTNLLTTEAEILEHAVTALAEETGVHIRVKSTDLPIDHSIIADAILEIGPKREQVYVETKRHAQNGNLGALILRVQRLPGNPILVADYINPVMAQKLKQENVQFIDVAGNAYINIEQTYIFIAGKKQNKSLHTGSHQESNRAFEPKGLIVTYGFLTNPTLLNASYREIAASTGVAVGTVGKVISALKSGKYIRESVKNKNRQITNYQKLLDRWVEAWPEKLKPKHYLGTFTTDQHNWWKDIPIQDYLGYWGGETAGAIYTGYLNPQVTTIYIPKIMQAKLIRKTRLVKAADEAQIIGEVTHMYSPFWIIESDNIAKQHSLDPLIHSNEYQPISADKGLANPVLVYADLVATGDTRNIETAEALYDRRIAQPNR